MTALPIDLALAVAAAGVDVNLSGDDLASDLRRAIADRDGYFDGPSLGDASWIVQLLAPHRVAFEGRTEEMALAWCLVFLMGERGVIGATHCAV